MRFAVKDRLGRKLAVILHVLRDENSVLRMGDCKDQRVRSSTKVISLGNEDDIVAPCP